jgi:hypothetical protein
VLPRVVVTFPKKVRTLANAIVDAVFARCVSHVALLGSVARGCALLRIEQRIRFSIRDA